MKFIVFTLLLVFSQSFIYQVPAQVFCTKTNRALCQQELNKLRSLEAEDMSIQEIGIRVGQDFLGTPYVAKTLEVGDEEQLVVDLQGLDCTTFIENVVVFSRLVKKGNLTYEAFLKELEFVRYRSGKLAAYPSRLHYFTEWILDNEGKNIIQDISGEIGGVPYPKQINFMSTHTSAYKQLSSQSFVNQIKAAEQRLNTHKRHYIPKADIPKFETNIQHGDLLAITTNIKGLDVSHVGMAFKKGKRVHLFHASTRSDQVEITDIPLSDYLAKSKSQSGIIVCRLVDPK